MNNLSVLEQLNEQNKILNEIKQQNVENVKENELIRQQNEIIRTQNEISRIQSEEERNKNLDKKINSINEQLDNIVIDISEYGAIGNGEFNNTSILNSIIETLTKKSNAMRKIKNAIKWVSRRMSTNSYWLPTGTFPC